MSRRTRQSSHRKGPEMPSRSPGRRTGVLIVLGFTCCLLYLGGMNRTLDLAVQVESLQQEYEALQRTVDRLELEVLEECGGQRVIELARQRLGMEFPRGRMEILAVLPTATRKGRSIRTYLENALAMTIEGVERRLYPSAHAGEPALPGSSATGSSGGGPQP